MNPIRFDDNNTEVELVTTGTKLNFSRLKSANPPALPTGPELPSEVEPKKRAYKRKNNIDGSTGVIKADCEVVEARTLDTYQDNLSALRTTINQIDNLTLDIKQDFDSLRSSKVVRGKYQYESMLSKNLTELISAKVAAIKEINNTIKNSNDLDYRREKDRRDMEANNDDQQIMSLYNAFVSSPISQGSSGRNLLGPSMNDINVAGSTGIVGTGNMDMETRGYNNWANNISPEQNLMRYENNPNVKQVVVYDAATGERHFDVRDMITGESIPNVPRRDDMFLKDTDVNPHKKVARNINLNETYPVIVLNEQNGMSEY